MEGEEEEEYRSSLYRVIQEERAIFLKVIVLAIVRKSLYEHLSNSERLPRESCSNVQMYENIVYRNKGR